MKIQVNDLKQLEEPGVYKIYNSINGHYYIGSTKMKIRLRLNNHLQALRRNVHKNMHLQRAWNKYGEESFIFFVLENCNRNVVYEREQYYLDNRDLNLSYNINSNATGFSENPETIEKLKKSNKIFRNLATIYYNKVKNKEITLNEVPVKFHQYINTWLNFKPWNKGKHYKSTEHLKVKHNFSNKMKEKYEKYSELLRNRNDVVYVYDENFHYIDCFRSSKDLEELSTKIKFPLCSRFKVKRGKCELNKLQSANINKAIKTGKLIKDYTLKISLYIKGLMIEMNQNR